MDNRMKNCTPNKVDHTAIDTAANLSMDSRKLQYNDLVNLRKKCQICKGLTNPAMVEGAKYDSDQIGPWSQWQGNLGADIMVVGQDWGDVRYFKDGEGFDKTSNPTNLNLQKLLLQLGLDIKEPNKTQESLIFLTNLVLCLKEGGLQAPLNNALLSNCADKFFRQLVEIVSPKIVITLGKNVTETILDLYEIPHSKSWNLIRLMQSGPFKLFGDTYLFPVYHCGAGGVNRNRPLIDQIGDWQYVAQWYRGDNTMDDQGYARKTVEIRGSDYWFKGIEFLQQNWALIEENPDTKNCMVYFIHDASGVFDNMPFSSIEKAVSALKRNSFERYSDDEAAQKALCPPRPPFFGEPRPIYSTGEFWR